MDLSPENFPLVAAGSCVYGRKWSSPLFTAPTPEMATTLAMWLNEYAAMKTGAGRSSSAMYVQHGPT